MGWLDKAKVALGILDPEDIEEDYIPKARPRTQNRDGRPSLDHIDAPPQQSLEDALVAREAGDLAGMRKLLREMDRGKGLRLVLRAAAALEAQDDDELRELLPKLRAEEPAWRLPLQVAAVLEDATQAEKLRQAAVNLGAPQWAQAWSKALSNDATTQRHGLVELLFADVALAHTVAARDLQLAEATANSGAAKRYAAFSHGRDCIKRFGAKTVAQLLEQV